MMKRIPCFSFLLLLLFHFLPRSVGADPWGAEGDAYVKGIHERVHPQWQSFVAELGRAGPLYQDPALRTEVVIGIDADGTIASIERTMLAGLKGFDDAPVDLIHGLHKLPPPPQSLRSDDGQVYLRWRFLRRAPGCEDAAIIERLLPLQKAIPCLAASGKADVAAARIKATPNLEPEARNALLTAMAEALGSAAAVLPDPPMRIAAARVLAHAREGEAALMVLTTDSQAGVRQAAFAALLVRPPSAAITVPLKKLLTANSVEDRAGAALLLHRLGDDSAIKNLRESLSAGPGEGAAAVAGALKTLGDGIEAANLTSKLLADPARQVSGVAAARALGDPALAGALLRALPTADGPLKRGILRALCRMLPNVPAEGKKALLKAIADPDVDLRAAVMRATPILGDKSIAIRYRLIDALGDPAPVVRAAAAAALVQVGGEATRDEVVRASRDKVAGVRVAVYQALKAHPLSGTASLVAHLGEDREVSRTVGDPEGPLFGDEGDADDVRALADRLLDTNEPLPRLKAAAAWLARIQRTDVRTTQRVPSTL